MSSPKRLQDGDGGVHLEATAAGQGAVNQAGRDLHLHYPSEARQVAAARDVADTVVAIPRQLPAAVAGFTGRAAQLKTLAGLLEQAGQRRTVVISAIDGMAGIGKTTLAVQWGPPGRRPVPRRPAVCEPARL